MRSERGTKTNLCFRPPNELTEETHHRTDLAVIRTVGTDLLVSYLFWITYVDAYRAPSRYEEKRLALHVWIKRRLRGETIGHGKNFICNVDLH